jgi:hypothetical protein
MWVVGGRLNETLNLPARRQHVFSANLSAAAGSSAD